MNTIPAITFNGVTLDEEKARHVRNLIEGRFVQHYYELVPDYKMNGNRSIAPTQCELDNFVQEIELCVAMNPNTFDQRPRIKDYIEVVDGKATLKFTLQECIDSHRECRQAFKLAHPNWEELSR